MAIRLNLIFKVSLESPFSGGISMRRIFAWLLLLPLMFPLMGCGSSTPDPREREDFVDTSDPSTMLNPMGDQEDQPK